MKEDPGSFQILGFETDDAAGVVKLRYGFESGLRFCETIEFHAPLPARGDERRAGFEAALAALNVLAGVSYYKAFAPETIEILSGAFSKEQVFFFEDLYLNGLGEFAVRNGVDLSNRARFECASTSQPVAGDAEAAVLTRRAAVLVGGGKDSLVSVEALRAADEPIVLFAVNPKKPILDCAAASDLPLISIARHLDPQLFELNAAGALNGHVPITAIVSFIALAAAFVHGFDCVVLSNERSANEPTLEHNGVAVNHQFSKTAGVEGAIRRYVSRNVASNLAYFSLLRPLSELHIARLFGKVERYDDVFTSCNRAFQLRATTAPARWCCNCPKCRFTFLMLATALPKERMLRIFGRNLLDDATQRVGYEELAGLSGHKPWECVGEIGESCAAVLRLAARPEWRDSLLLKELAPRLEPFSARLEQEWRVLLSPSAEHSLSPHFESVLNAYLA